MLYHARGRHSLTLHRERSSGLTTTCGCLFGFVCKKKSPRSWRELAEKRALSARRLFLFVDGCIWEYMWEWEWEYIIYNEDKLNLTGLDLYTCTQKCVLTRSCSIRFVFLGCQHLDSQAPGSGYTRWFSLILPLILSCFFLF